MNKKQLSKNKQLKGYPVVKKQLKHFLMDEEGKITKKDIAKLGVSLAVLGMMIQPTIASAQHSNYLSGHSSSLDTTNNGHFSNTNHTNTHANHSNAHGAHSSGGWGC